MRVFLFCLIGLAPALSGTASAQMKLSPKSAPAANETRYFTSIDGLMDGNADIILKETRQGKTVTAAVLDVCYPAEKGSERKDRFVANLAVSGQTLTGTAQSVGDKLPVSVKLNRKATGDTFEFKGQITVGQTTTEVTSTDNSDLSEAEFQENQTSDESIVAAPKDFTEVSPESIAVKVKLDAALELLKSLRGQNVEVALNSLPVSCDALRAGEQTINISVDPERASSVLARLKSMPGVVSAGWTSGIVESERTIRFTAGEWRDGDKLNRDKIAAAISGVLSRTLSAKSSSAVWNENTGKLKLILKRPSQLFPALELTENIELSALVGPEKPGTSDRLILWLGAPSITTKDETTGAKLNLADTTGEDEEADPKDDNGSVEALAKEFKAQRWNPENSSWK